MRTDRSKTESYPAARVCRYLDCVNAKDDGSNACPHHEPVDAECASICGEAHDASYSDERCRCWITCNECRRELGYPRLDDADFETTVREVA